MSVVNSDDGRGFPGPVRLFGNVLRYPASTDSFVIVIMCQIKDQEMDDRVFELVLTVDGPLSPRYSQALDRLVDTSIGGKVDRQLVAKLVTRQTTSRRLLILVFYTGIKGIEFGHGCIF